MNIASVLAFLVSVFIFQLCLGEITIKKVRKSVLQGTSIDLTVEFEISQASELYGVTWTTSHGESIQEQPSEEMEGPISVDRKTTIQIDSSDTDWTVSVYIGTSLDWVRLTIDVSAVNDNVDNPALPRISFPDHPDGKMNYTGGTGKFNVEHSEVPDAYTQLDKAPLYAFAWLMDGTTLTGGDFFSEIYGWQSSKTVTSRTVNFMLWDVTPMVVSLVFRNLKEPDNFLLTVEVGRSLIVLTGADSVFPDSFSAAKQNGAVNCYDPRRCHLMCVVAGGRAGSTAELQDSEGNTLVSVPQNIHDPLTRIVFSPAPRSVDIKDLYRCVVTDGNGHKQRRGINVNFRMIYSIQEEDSGISKNGGVFEAVCVVEGFPPPENSSLEFTFAKEGQEPKLVKKSARPTAIFWNLYEVRASLAPNEVPKANSFTLQGATCEFRSTDQYGFNAQAFIPFDG